MINSIDQLILKQLQVDCRTSLQDLAALSGVSANEVKKRIENLQSSGIIREFLVILSPPMTEENSVIAILNFDIDPDEKHLFKKLGSNPLVHRVSRVHDGRYLVLGVYFNQEELKSLTHHLREHHGLRNVELHSRFLHYWGGKIKLTNISREILKCLVRNPRMPVSEIAKETGFHSNAIKESIDLMKKSEAVLFTLGVGDALNAGSIEVFAKVQWNVGTTNKEQLLDWLQSKFALLHLDDFISATEPTLFFKFFVKDVREVEMVVQKIVESGLAVIAEPLILSPGTTFPDPRVRRVHQVLEETGFSLN
ncbi:MAG: Lrp/AsnC family transcriptional regulator [Candidatus Thorarchaeota archaeon]|nr:Lrp/AsnC family transcriptional regulator [Candidatus Thorarchaeota archaeon]